MNRLKCVDTAYHMVHFLYHLSGVAFELARADIAIEGRPIGSPTPHINPAIIERLSSHIHPPATQRGSKGCAPRFRFRVCKINIYSWEVDDIVAELSVIQQFITTRRLFIIYPQEEHIPQIVDILTSKGRSLLPRELSEVTIKMRLRLSWDFVDTLVEVGM